jgi:hypothetical protein
MYEKEFFYIGDISTTTTAANATTTAADANTTITATAADTTTTAAAANATTTTTTTTAAVTTTTNNCDENVSYLGMWVSGIPLFLYWVASLYYYHDTDHTHGQMQNNFTWTEIWCFLLSGVGCLVLMIHGAIYDKKCDR